MRRLLTTFFLLMTLCSFAQEQMHIPSRRNVDAPKAIQETRLFGKTIIMFGDSYIQNGGRPIEESWHYKLALKYNMDYYNYGLNGNCIAYDRTAEKCGFPLYERVEELPDKADYVIVCAGHNDAVLIHRIGEGTGFFRSKMALLCKELKAKFPNAKICFITPWAVPQPMYPEMIDTMQEVCEEYAIPFFDASKYSGIHVNYRGFRRLYFQDANDMAHLNAKGHDIFAPKIEHFLLEL